MTTTENELDRGVDTRERSVSDGDGEPTDGAVDMPIDVSVDGHEPTAPKSIVDDTPIRRIPRLSLAVLGIGVAIVRWWFSHDRDVFHVAPDEPGSLAMARWLSGGTRWSMFDHATWRPGLATLIAPIYWLTDDAATVVHGALMINAAIAGIAAAILARLALRLTDLSPIGCVLAAAAIALTPASLSASANIWAESLVTATSLATIWYLLTYFDRPRLVTGIAAIGWSIVGVTSHGRLMPLIATTAMLTVGQSLWRHRWWRAAGLTTFTALGSYASFAYADFVFEAVWDSPADNNTVNTVIERLDDPVGLLTTALGQAWYQLVATLGLFGVGSFLVLRACIWRSGSAGLRPSSARIVAFSIIPLLGLSTAFMTARTRSDHLIYGRYNDAVVWPVLLIAVAWLVRLAHVHRWARSWALASGVVIAMVSSGIGVYLLHDETLSESVGVRPMIAGLLPWLGTNGSIHALWLTAAGVAGFLVLLVLARWPGPRSAVLIGVVTVGLAVGGVRAHEALARQLNGWGVAAAVIEIDDGIVPTDATLGVRFVRDSDDPAASWNVQRRRAQLYQMYLPNHRFLRDQGTDDSVGPYVFAPVGDPALVEVGAEVLWTDPGTGVALWREPITP